MTSTRGRRPSSYPDHHVRPTHSRIFELTRHFLLSMFDGEWSSSRGQWKSVAVGIFAAALPAGMLMLRVPGERPAPALAEQLALQVALASLTGLVALLVWQSLFPGRRDYFALAGLPVRPREIFGARLAAVAIFAAVLTVSLNLLPVALAGHRGPQAASAALECLFVFFAVVSLQGVLLNVLPARLFVRVSVYVQGLLFALCAMGILRCWSIKEWDDAMLARLPEFAWAPPVWFAALHEALAGSADPFLAAMGSRAIAAGAIAIAVSVAAYWLSYRRYRRLLLEAPEGAGARRFAWSALGWAARNPRQRAIVTFMAATMARSRTHRLVWLAYVGFALAVVLNSSIVNGAFLVHNRRRFFGAVQFLVLFWPLACSVILLPGIRHAFRIPAELPASWIFRLNESYGRADWLVAVQRFVLLYTLGPLYAFTVPAALFTLPWEIAARMLALQLLVSLIVFEMLFYSWQQLPFACSYLPGRKPLVNVFSTYVVVLGILVPLVSVIVAAASRFPPLFVVLGAGFLAAWLKVRSMRREGADTTPLLYEDSAALAPNLGIHDISSRTPSSDPPSPPPLLRPATSSGPRR